MVSADGIIFNDEVIIVEGTDSDETVFENPFFTVSFLLSDDSAFTQVDGCRFTFEVRNFSRGDIILKFIGHRKHHLVDGGKETEGIMLHGEEVVKRGVGYIDPKRGE